MDNTSLKKSQRCGRGPTITEGKIYLVRHGQSRYNKAGFFARLVHPMRDPRLTSFGRQQARLAACNLSGIKFDHVISSPLRRAEETALIAFGNRNTNFETWESCSEWMIAPADVPIRRSSLSSLRSYKSKYVEGAAYPLPSTLTKSYRRTLIRAFHQAWFLLKGITPESPNEFGDRVEFFRDLLVNRTSGNVAIFGHARFFNQLVGGQIMNNGEIHIVRRDELQHGSVSDQPQ